MYPIKSKSKRNCKTKNKTQSNVPFPAGGEKFIQWIWEKQLLRGSLLTEDLQQIRVVYPGRLNLDDGPDFKNAIISFLKNKPNKHAEGDAEIHIFSADWNLHNHHKDPKYNKVILHIITQDNGTPCKTSAGDKVPTLNISKWTVKPLAELLKDYKKEIARTKAFSCKYKKGIPAPSLINLIELQGLKRFELRKQKFQNLIEKHGIEQALYSGIMESLGYVRNEKAFIKLAGLANVDKLKWLLAKEPIKNHINIIKTALLGTAGLLTKNLQPLWDGIKDAFPETMNFYEWQLFKVRPQGFPANRINGISCFLAETLQAGIHNSLAKSTSEKMTEKLQANSTLIGKNCAKTITLNVCLPLMANIQQEAKSAYMSYRPLPKNYITDYMEKILWKPNKQHHYEIYYQGLIHIYQKFCKEKQCNICPIKLEPKTTDTKLCN